MDNNVKSISDLQPSFFSQKKEKIVNEHQSVMKDFMLFMGEDNKDSKRFKYWSGRLSGRSSSQIYDAMKVCRDKKNPPAYFNWLLKNKKI